MCSGSWLPFYQHHPSPHAGRPVRRHRFTAGKFGVNVPAAGVQLLPELLAMWESGREVMQKFRLHNGPHLCLLQLQGA